MAQYSKAEILARCDAEFRQLEAELNAVDPSVVGRKCKDGTSIKEYVVYSAYMIRQYLTDRSAESAGDVCVGASDRTWDQAIPASGNETCYAPLSWAASRALLRASHAVLMDFLEQQEEATLFPMSQNNTPRCLAARFEMVGPGRYHQTGDFVRECLQQVVPQTSNSA